MSAHASAVSNADVSFVENAITGAPVFQYQYGTVSVTSVLPCSGAGCQDNAGNPLTTFSTSQSSAGGVASAKSSADLTTGVLRAYAQEDGISGAGAAASAGFWDTLTFSGVTGVNPTATLWLFGSGMIGLLAVARRCRPGSGEATAARG